MAYICIHTHKLNCANIPPPVSFFLRLQRHPNGPRPVYMLSAIFRDDLFFFELSGFLREVDRKRGRGEMLTLGKKGCDCWVAELATTGDTCVLRAFRHKFVRAPSFLSL